jgi:acyl dehydratase
MCITRKGTDMAVHSAAIGLTTEPQLGDITPRQLLAYAAGIGATSPRYLDDAATEMVAHPAFCVVLEWPAALALRQHPQFHLPREEALRAVHAEQDSIFHRPIRPGDCLQTVATLIQVRRITPGAYTVTKLATVDAATQEPVVTSYASTIYRGVSVEGPDTQIDTAPPLPAAPSQATWSHQVAMPVPREAPYVYTECAQIWNPIHTERRVALAAGLPDIILHGTATWALAATQLIHGCAGGEPTRLQRLVGRFAAMVIPGTTITLHYGAAPEAQQIVRYRVCNAEGSSAIDRGMAVLIPSA